MTARFIHKTGGGVIFGIDGSVSSDSYLERGSEVRGASYVSCLSSISDDSVIHSCHVVSSSVESTIALKSHLADSEVGRAMLDSVVIRGAYGREAQVTNVILSGGVVVEGCMIKDVELAGPYLVHIDFDHTPRHFLLKGPTGVSLGLIECQPGFAHCGCVCRPIDEWIAKKELDRRLFTKKRNWSGGEVDVIHEVFNQWR